MVNKLYHRYWGKSAKDGSVDPRDYHLLAYHCLDVAAIGSELLSSSSKLGGILSRNMGVDQAWLRQWYCFWLVLHDLGKFSRSFQSLVDHQSASLVAVDPAKSYRVRHDSLGFVLWGKELEGLFLGTFKGQLTISQVKPWVEIVTGHHGEPPLSERSVGSLDQYFLAEDISAAKEFSAEVCHHFLQDFDVSPLQEKRFYKHKTKQQSWLLAGVAVLV